jgi:hypothetical protein
MMKKLTLVLSLIAVRVFAQNQPAETPDRIFQLGEVKITGDSVKDSHQSLSSQRIEKFNCTELTNTRPGNGFVLEIYPEATREFFNSF